MQMTDGEIRRNYKEAKNKQRQIKILAELNGCSQDEIRKVLFPKENNSSTSSVEVSEEVNSGDIMNLLFARLDELEDQIKPLEEEYRRVKIAIDVIQKVRTEHGKDKTA